MIKATIKIGAMNLAFEAENMKDVFKWSGLYGNLPKQCDSCQSENLFLSHRGDKEGHDYFGIKCKDCGAEGKFGQHKVGGGLFYKWDNKMEKYVPGPPSGPSGSQQPTDSDRENLPF